MSNYKYSPPRIDSRYRYVGKQKNEVSKHDTQGNLEWQAQYDTCDNKISVSHYNNSGLIRRERYDTQNNLIEVHHYDGKGHLVKHLLLN